MKTKTIFLILSIISVALIFASCTRRYTCQCTMTYSGAPSLPKESVSEFPIRDTKKKAKSYCEGRSKVYNENGQTTTEDCELF